MPDRAGDPRKQDARTRVRAYCFPPGMSRPKAREGRHYGPVFNGMVAAAAMADYTLTNEALAMLIRRIQRSGKASARS